MVRSIPAVRIPLNVPLFEHLRGMFRCDGTVLSYTTIYVLSCLLASASALRGAMQYKQGFRDSPVMCSG